MANEILDQSPFHLCSLVLSLACLKLDTPLAGTWQLSVRILYTTQHIPDTHPVSSRAKLSQNNTGCNERKHRHMLLITDHYKWYDDAHTRPWSQHNTIVTCVLYDQIMCTDVDSDYSLITDDHDATCYKQLTCAPEPVYASVSITYACPICHLKSQWNPFHWLLPLLTGRGAEGGWC